MSPKITVVIPVYNRDEKLRRAIRSVREQTFADFECIVVDDGSTIPVEPIVNESGDSRFVYVRNARNGGPYNARTCGYRRMRGQYLFHLDSDWEAFPWALSQAVHYLDHTPEVDGVTGLHLRNCDSSLFVRVRNGRRIVTPDEAVTMAKVPDCVGAVRRCVVDEWLEKRSDYFALESHQWFTFGLAHSQLYVDEPWTRYYTEGRDRVSTTFDQRRLDDFVIFLEEHRFHVENTRSAALDQMLVAGWKRLASAGREEAKQFEECLVRRGVKYKRSFSEKAREKTRSVFRKTVGRLAKNVQAASPVYYL